MKSYIVYQLGYDSDSDQEFMFTEGLFVIHESNPSVVEAKIVGYANHYWGTDWWGLSYQEWDCDDLDANRKRVFRYRLEAAE